MGLKDRILDFIAARFSPAMDHPAGDGITGAPQDDDTDEQPDDKNKN